MTSIRLKLTLGSAALFAAGVGILLAANALFMEPYYAARTKRAFESIRGRMRSAPASLTSQLGAVRTLAAGTGYKIVVADRAGIVKASSVPEFQEGQSFPLPKDQLDFFLERRERMGRGESYFGILDAAPRGQSVIQLMSALPSDRYLVITQPLEQVRASIAAASPFFLLIGSLVLVLEYSLVLALSARLTSPILELAGVARRIAQADYGARCQRPRDDELGVLGDSLNAMAAALAANIQKLTAANEELARKMKAQEDFIAGASHELKTPVGLVRGYAEAIKLGLFASDAERDELADVILKEADHLNLLVTDLAHIAALDGEGRSLDLADEDLLIVASRAVGRFGLAAKEKSIDLRLEGSGPVPARFDADRIVQVIDNLLTNAFRHAPENGSVVVRIGKDDDTLRLEVENTGEPIPEEQIPRLFEPFYRTDASRSRKIGGTGLGLALVKGIVLAHRGSLGARNTDAGVLFWVSLPARL